MKEERTDNSNRQSEADRMEIEFKRPTFENIDHALSYEWIETDNRGNYASSTILGVNTSKKHGLFVLGEKGPNPGFLILSHLQEEIFQGEKKYSLHNTEYKTNKDFQGVEYQKRFALDPIPTFTYECNELKLEKSVFLVSQANRLIVFYKLIGKMYPGCRMVIRPFFGFRPANSTSDPELFKNMETFLSDRNLRYLPFQEAPEIFMFYSEGQFVNAPVWYHDVYYRGDLKTETSKEELLNLGFFEIPLSTTGEFYLSFGLDTTNSKEIKEYHQSEIKRRRKSFKTSPNKNSYTIYLSSKVNNFQITPEKKRPYFIPEPLTTKFNLSNHCFMARRLLQSSADPRSAKMLYDDLLYLIENNNLIALLNGTIKDISVNPGIPFYLVLFLYTFHSLFDNPEHYSSSFTVVQEIITNILKNQFPDYLFKRNKLLERKYMDSDLAEKYDHEMYFPIRQNLILNALWYNTLKIGEFLANAVNESSRKYTKYARKLQKNFFKQFIKSFSLHPSKALDHYKFAFHPAMIYAISLPFPILGERDEQLLFRVLIKQFLSSQGIKYPIRREEKSVTVISPLLASEYLLTWQRLMPKKDSIFLLFQKMGENFEQSISKGVLGFVPDALGKSQVDLGVKRGASGPATSEVIYFLTLLNKIEKERGKFVNTAN
jgi:hypothetical protein